VSRRKEQIESVLLRAVQQVVVKGFQDPRIRGLITLTACKVSEDMRNATISVSVLPESAESLTVHALQDAARHVRREAGELVSVDRLPELRFKVDRSAKTHAAVSSAINKAVEELEARKAARGEGSVGSADGGENEGHT
jgi:ribosome-binding factor A